MKAVTVILAIASHNDGAGKTVTAANVAAGFARAGRRTLAVDCDAQAHQPVAPRPRRRGRRRHGGDRHRRRRPGHGLVAPHPPAWRGSTPRHLGWPISRALAADGTLIARALGRLRARYDAIVLDLPSSLSLAVSAWRPPTGS